MNRGVLYCTHVYRRYKKRPIISTICIKEVSPSSLLEGNFKPRIDDRFLYEASCSFWADRCLLLSRATIEAHINEDEPLHPLVALTMFLTYGERCRMALPRWDDQTIQVLCSVAKQFSEETEHAEDGKLKALQVISEVHEKQYSKIRACLTEEPPNISKSLQDLENGLSYSGRLKGKYDAALEHEDEPPETLTPMEEPPETTSASSTTSTVRGIHIKAMQFLADYMASNKGKRMSWKDRHDKGVKEGRITSYSTSESLRVSYTTYKQ